MTTTRPHLSHPSFSKPDLYTTGPGRMPRLSPEEAAWFYPLTGNEPGGYQTAADARVTRTLDGVPINDIWAEAQAAMAAYNADRTKLSALVSFPTTSPADPIAQNVGGLDFEEASEMGVASAHRPKVSPLLMGYTFKDYDVRVGFTWKFLRDAPAEQVRQYISEVMEGDNRLVTGGVLRRLFDNTSTVNEFNHAVRPLYTGLDGAVPPPFAGRTFTSSASHMLGSGNTVLDPGDLADLINAVRSKGYGFGNSRLLLLMHPAEAEVTSTFRRGIVTNGVESKYDAIPSASAPAYLSEANTIGAVAPAQFGGLDVLCSFGPALVIPSYFIPQGYVACVASSGPNSAFSPVALREHTDPQYRGLRMLAGNNSRYPLIDSEAGRSFGVGIRYRGAAAVLKVGSSTTYTPPTWTWS